MKLVIGALLIVYVIAQDDKCKLYKCNPSDLYHVTMIIGSMEQVLKCPNGEKCNSRFITPCDPCISDTCNDLYTCDEDDFEKITIGGNVMSCPLHFKCNTGNEEPCTPCIPTTCFGFVCTGNTSYYFEEDNTQHFCAPGYKCNSENLQPCTGCIKDETTTTTSTTPLTISSTQTTLSTTTPSTTTLSTTTPPTTTSSTTTPSSTTPFTTTTTPKTTTPISTTLSTSTTTTTTTTTVKPFVTPNCNDGGGWRRPCREGPNGYYFKCILFDVLYVTAKLNCARLGEDSLCKNANVCKF